MKLLFAIKGLHRAAGGAERVICDVSSACVDSGHGVGLLTFDDEDALPFYEVASAVKVVGIGVGDPYRRTSPKVLLKRICALRTAVQREHPDVVIAFMHSMFVPMAFALIGTGIPLIASEHIVRAHYRTRPLEMALFLLAMPFIKACTVLSERIKQEYPWPIRRKMVPISNPLSRQFVNASCDGAANSKRILSIGRFDPQKDHLTLVRAFANLSREFPAWTLRIVGDGEMRESLMQWVKAEGLEDRISMPGIVKDVIDELRQASFFALASRYESFGLVVVEALALGRPVVGFADCVGVNELIQDHETGLLVRGADRVRALEMGLRMLMENHRLRECIGKRARDSVRDRSVDKVMPRWQALLEEVVQR